MSNENVQQNNQGQGLTMKGLTVNLPSSNLGAHSTSESWNTYTTAIPSHNIAPYTINTPPFVNQLSMHEITMLRALISNANQLMMPKQTPLEEIMGKIFNDQEKKDFLESIGYQFYMNENASKMRTKEGEEMYAVYADSFFIKEITIKFKNLLLAKPTLKIKL